MSSHLIENLQNAIFEFNSDRAKILAKEIIEKKIDPMQAISAMTGAIREVGDGFARGELWLPDLIGAAKAMQSAMPFLEEEIKSSGSKRAGLGTAVVGTVFGDIHSIGKTMVCVLLRAEGFEVHDLGVNIQAEEFINAIKKYKADILAMSALLTTTAPEQKKVIDFIKKEGLRNKIKIIVGGAAISERFSQEIGADGYDPTAPGAAKLVRKLIGK